MKSYGERLEEALVDAKKDRQALADEIGVSVQAIGQVIAGKTKALTAENTAYAAKALNVSFYWLASGKGEKRPDRSEPSSDTFDSASLKWPFTMSFQDISSLPPEDIASLDRYISYTVRDWKLRQVEGKKRKESAIDKHTDGFLHVGNKKNVG